MYGRKTTRPVRTLSPGKSTTGCPLSAATTAAGSSGNAPRNGWLVNCLAEAVKNGKTIVNISQCATGSVEMERYETGRQLLEAGIISGHDSTVEAALAKLMFLRGKGCSQAEIQRLMNTSIAGEITL